MYSQNLYSLHWKHSFSAFYMYKELRAETSCFNFFSAAACVNLYDFLWIPDTSSCIPWCYNSLIHSWCATRLFIFYAIPTLENYYHQKILFVILIAMTTFAARTIHYIMNFLEHVWTAWHASQSPSLTPIIDNRAMKLRSSIIYVPMYKKNLDFLLV